MQIKNKIDAKAFQEKLHVLESRFEKKLCAAKPTAKQERPFPSALLQPGFAAKQTTNFLKKIYKKCLSASSIRNKITNFVKGVACLFKHLNRHGQLTPQ